MRDDTILVMDSDAELQLEEDGGGDSNLVNDLPYYRRGTDDYEELEHKPILNGRTIIGDQTVAFYLQDGLIINGGDSTGYDPPVVPTGVPDAEGVMF